MRIAHLSDLHLLSLEGAVPFRLLNKRLTGYANLRFHRSAIHKPFAAKAAARTIRELGVDHVVITGDTTNLALEVEFDLVEAFLRDDLGLPPQAVSLVPGNHDVYTAGAFRDRRFCRYFAQNLTSDLPELAEPSSPFPYVRLRGPVAIIGLSTAVPRPPLVASGRLGEAQRLRLTRVLAHPEVARRTPVILQHHPLINPPSRKKTLLNGLSDADLEQRILGDLPRGLVLHGHLHRRVHTKVSTGAGQIDVVGTTSASLVGGTDETMAGFNVYEVADDGAITDISSFRMREGGERFDPVSLEPFVTHA